ncbi:MAG: uncharacterized protein KVP18_002660 [Porospora cf. gigantea A]|uniref:uncharacterized protein n=1 Tax=Porospora cf. gigantea A TaxID=2853593 RepID=UPI00355A7E87|nr:MAG: hypothetical protein KVP18_002660 [Porospora cf. gigantea A]
MQKQPTTDPADFLKQVLGRPVVVQTTLTMTYRGILACLDPKMNLVLEKCEEIEDGEILNVFNETLVRGNNVLYIAPAVDTMGSGIAHGIKAARVLRTRRRSQRWADKDYKKSHLGTQWKCNPFKGASHAKGIVVQKIGVEAKQPNSANRKCVRVQLIRSGKTITAFVPRDGSLNFIDQNDEVLVSGFGRSGHAVGDIPGVRFKVVKVAGTSLMALFKGKKEKPKN